MDYTTYPTPALQVVRASLLSGLRNPRVANRAQVLRWVNEIEGELLARAEKEMPMSKVERVQTGWVSTPTAAKIDEIRNPATGELLGFVRPGRYAIEAWTVDYKHLGDYYGADARVKAADRIWSVWERKQKVAA